MEGLMVIRQPLSRAWRPARFTPEALALFVRLEGMRRDDPAFKDGERELARMLNLSDVWLCSGISVNDTDPEPCWPLGHAAYEDFFTVRRVRNALLAAAGMLPGEVGSQ
jgi:hypothetical protein